MDPLSIVSSIVAILQLSSKVIGYLTAVKDASKERAQCAIEVSNLHSLLLNLKFHIETKNVNNLWQTAVRALAIKNGPLEQFKQSLETLQSGMTDRGRLKKATGILMWKFKKDEMANILERIERLKTLIEIALQRDQMELSQAIKFDTQIIKADAQALRNSNWAIKDDTQNIKDHTELIRFGIDSVKIQGENVEHHRILEWISPSNYPAQQSDIIKQRHDETGGWFLEAPQVNKWLNEPHTTLFCSGIPGAGKTVIAAIAVDHLLRYMQRGSIGVAYIYCNYKAKVEQNVSHMLAAVLKQLVRARPQLLEPIRRLHTHHHTRSTNLSDKELFSTLDDTIAHYSTTYIVVDALDECQDSDGTRRQFLARLDELQAKWDVRLMFTSRPIPEIANGLQNATRIEIQTSKGDVERYLAGQLYRLPRCIQDDTKFQAVIQDTIVEASGGMFLLAKLFVDSLLDKRTKTKVKSTLKTIGGEFQAPNQAYDQAYDQAIERIEGQLPGDTALAKRVLAWVTNARRPLTIIEMCHAIAIEPGQESLDPDDIPHINDLVSVCAGLVSVDEESKIVRLVHHTTQEYLERIQKVWNPQATVYVASTCITYLSFAVFQRSTAIDHFQKSWIDQNPFLRYTAQHWGQHTQVVQNEVREQAYSFLSNDSLVTCVAQVVSRLKNLFWTRSGTHLHLMSQFGLHVLLEDFMPISQSMQGRFIDTRDYLNLTPLCWAAECGHEDVVRILLRNGADIEGSSYYSLSPLRLANLNGHESIVRLLLDEGADINGRGSKEDRSALQVAITRAIERSACQCQWKRRWRILHGQSVERSAEISRYGSIL